MQIGDTVTYRDINLQDYRGTIVALGRTTHGGDCLVRWRGFPGIPSEECLAHLRHLPFTRRSRSMTRTYRMTAEQSIAWEGTATEHDQVLEEITEDIQADLDDPRVTCVTVLVDDRSIAFQCWRP